MLWTPSQQMYGGDGIKPELGWEVDDDAAAILGPRNLYLLNEGCGGTGADAVTGKPLTLSGVTWAQGGLRSNSTSDYASTGLADWSAAQGTVIWRAKTAWGPTDGGQHHWWGQYNGTGTEFSAQKYSDNNLYIGWATTTSARVTVSASSAGQVANVYQTWALTWGSFGSRLYRDGALVGTNATVPATTALAGFPLYLLNCSGQATHSGTGDVMDWWAVASRAWSQTQIAEFVLSDLTRAPHALGTVYSFATAPTTSGLLLTRRRRLY